VEEVEAEATYPAPEDAHAQRAGELEGAAASAREGVEALTATLAELEAQRATVREALTRLADRERELERVVGAVEPRTRHTLSLYAHVSKVVWDFEARGRVAGTVDDPGAGTLEAFDFGEEPDFESVNALWVMIGGARGENH
jgi:kinetochore protein Spc24